MIKRIQIVFTKDVHLPRFGMKKGSTWEVRVDKLGPEGFPLGGGFVFNDDYDVTGYIKGAAK